VHAAPLWQKHTRELDMKAEVVGAHVALHCPAPDERFENNPTSALKIIGPEFKSDEPRMRRKHAKNIKAIVPAIVTALAATSGPPGST
jgi:hypothetical protein